eukprot:1022680-Alexandrium_andersonii.AAC.1
MCIRDSLGSFGDQFQGHVWARAVQASNSSSNFEFLNCAAPRPPQNLSPILPRAPFCRSFRADPGSADDSED